MKVVNEVHAADGVAYDTVPIDIGGDVTPVDRSEVFSLY